MRLIVIVLVTLFSGCIIQLRQPDPPPLTWDDPRVVANLIDNIFADIKDLTK